ncbi:hypothetical protein EON67_11700 [archaeon]|nr:MAG: hypothetical protein EON67_11700 [archaeon]
MRLLSATLHRFYQRCISRGVVLPARGFEVSYHTTIPRQVGLAGSSAIVTAFVRALLAFFGMCPVSSSLTCVFSALHGWACLRRACDVRAVQGLRMRSS